MYINLPSELLFLSMYLFMYLLTKIWSDTLSDLNYAGFLR